LAAPGLKAKQHVISTARKHANVAEHDKFSWAFNAWLRRASWLAPPQANCYV
jgi:hypothetical protein